MSSIKDGLPPSPFGDKTPETIMEKYQKTPSANGHESEAEDELRGEVEYPKGVVLLLIVAAVMLSIFLACLDTTIVATAIPKITDQFHSLDDVSWYGSAFFLTMGGFQSAWGKAYKYFDLKWTYIFAVFVFELGSLICGVAPSSTALIVGRAIAGVGVAGLSCGSYTIIAFVAEPKKRPMFTGLVGAAYGIASVIGPLVGGVFADKLTWRWCFYINLPVGAAAVTTIFFFFHTPKAAKPVPTSWKEKILQLDPAGIALVMGGIIMFVLAMQIGGQTKPWSSGEVIGLLVGFGIITIAFGVWEYLQGERAMVVPRLVCQRSTGASSMSGFFFAGSYFLVIYYLPIYFQSVDDANPTQSGVDNLPLILAASVGVVSSGFIAAATGSALPIFISGAAVALIAAGLLYTLDVGTSTGKWIGYQILGGLGWGIGFQVPVMIGQAGATAEDMSSVMAIIQFLQYIGSTFFLSAAQAGFANTLVKTLPHTAPEVDPAAVIASGATELRMAFTPAQVAGIVQAYMAGVKVALALAIPGTGLALVIGLFNSWKRVNESVVNNKDAATV